MSVKGLEDKAGRRVCAALQPTAALLASPSAAPRRQSKSPPLFRSFSHDDVQTFPKIDQTLAPIIAGH